MDVGGFQLTNRVDGNDAERFLIHIDVLPLKLFNDGCILGHVNESHSIGPEVEELQGIRFHLSFSINIVSGPHSTRFDT